MENEMQDSTPDINVQDTDNTEVSELEALKAEMAKKDEQIADLARFKREAKREKKAQETEKSEPKQSNEFGLVEKTYLKAAGISDSDEIELARTLMKETGKELDVLIEGNYFKAELAALRDEKATVKATSGVKGGTGQNKAVETPEYWISKGTPPTKDQVPDRATRAKIARAMMQNASTGGKKFYND